MLWTHPVVHVLFERSSRMYTLIAEHNHRDSPHHGNVPLLASLVERGVSNPRARRRSCAVTSPPPPFAHGQHGAAGAGFPRATSPAPFLREVSASPLKVSLRWRHVGKRGKYRPWSCPRCVFDKGSFFLFLALFLQPLYTSLRSLPSPVVEARTGH